MHRWTHFLLIILLVVVVGFLPRHTQAGVIVSEVMYDPQGIDADHEWVEIYNSGSDTVEITKDWRFVVGGDNHTLVSSQGGESIPAGGHAVIVSKPEVFLSDYSAFSGIIFDSSFSLNNTGTILSLKNGDTAESSTSYSSDSGAVGDGNSLNWVDGSWKPATPTPGRVAADTSIEETDSSSGNASSSGSSSSGSASSVTTLAPKEVPLSIKMSVPQIAVAGAHTQFSVVANGSKTAISRCSFSWNFGDGDVQKGKEVYREYTFTGDYIIVLDASCKEKQLTLRQKIKIIPPDIGIAALTRGGIEIANRTPYELNLSGWHLRGGSYFFTIPNNTFIVANTKIAFANSVTKLPTADVALMYPNGAGVTEDYSLATRMSAPVVQNFTYTPSLDEGIPEENYIGIDMDTGEGKVPKEASTATNTPQMTASVQDRLEDVPDEFWGSYGWVLGLIGVIIVALGAFFVGARSFPLTEKKGTIVDEITFVE
ncbi:MAG: lamin tail domain-containing protein [Candidatus Paceibacterota bacterium]|jgi:hypothetical protein